MITTVKNILLDFAYPPYCISCDIDGEWFCDACTNKVLNRSSFKGSPDGFVDFFSLGMYSYGALRKLIHALKYRRAGCCLDSVGRLIKRFAETHILFQQLMAKDDVHLYFVPSDELRVRERGIDHTKALAECIRSIFPQLTLHRSLIKTRHVLPNASLPSNAARKGNTKDAFMVAERAFGTCLLIDDVYTTGATMQACRSALKKSGAGEVYGFVLARR